MAIKIFLAFVLFSLSAPVFASSANPMYRVSVYQSEFYETKNCPKTHFIYQSKNERHCVIDLYKNKNDSFVYTKNYTVKLRESFDPKSKIIANISAWSRFHVWDKRWSSYIWRYFDSNGNWYLWWLSVRDVVLRGEMLYFMPNEVWNQITYLAKDCPKWYKVNGKMCEINLDFLLVDYGSGFDPKSRTILLNTDDVVLYSKPNAQSPVKYSWFADVDVKKFLYSKSNNSENLSPYVKIYHYSENKDWYWVLYDYWYWSSNKAYWWMHKSSFLYQQ